VSGGSVTDNNRFRIRRFDLLTLLLQLKSIITAHNQWLSTRSIPYCTTSVFSSTVTDLVLVYESVTSPVSAVRWLTLSCWTLNYQTAFCILLRLPRTTTVLRMNCSSLHDSLYSLAIIMGNDCCLPSVRETRFVLNWSVGIYLRSNVC
jgi:hypothetical protein